MNGSSNQQGGSSGSSGSSSQSGSGGDSSSNSQSTTPCPISELEGNQIALVCPTGFRRHPKYCNLFYQCSLSPNNLDTKILVLSCPNGTVYDDARVQCLPANEASPCNGEIALEGLYRRLNDNSLPPVNFTN